VKRTMTVVLALTVAALCQGATVVLRGGKHLDVASWEQRGSYVVVKYAGGRVESYPVDAVDLDATRTANHVAPARPAPTPAGPQSPFAAALAQQGSASATITDSDVSHPAPAEPDQENQGEEAGNDMDAQVVLVSYDKRPAGEGQWEVTATVANQGKAPASGVVVNAKFLGPKGEVLGTGSGSLAGNLAPQMQGAVTLKVASQVEPTQIGFDLQWQSIREVPPTPTPLATAVTKAKPVTPAPPAARPPTGYGIPAGAGPNTVPVNPTGMGPINQVPNPPQVPAPTTPPT
jgi:hypothetical protein